jgi:transposase
MVRRIEADGPNGRNQVHVHLRRTATRMRCSGCGRWSREVHEISERCVRDLPILDADTFIWFPRYRLACNQCGPKVEALSWLSPWARVTSRMAESVVRLCRLLPIKHVADWYHLGWDAVKSLDKAALQHELLPIDLSGVDMLAMDEFALRKGHRYATVIIDPIRKRVLWVGRGRKREDIRPFFDLLGEEGCRRIRAVAMDMNPAYEEEVRARCPHAEIVYDLFHVVAKYGREVIDRVRVDEANRLRHDQPARKVVKSARWLLLRNRENLTRTDRIRLNELLSANRRLALIYILRDDLKHLWDYRYRGSALRFFQQWYRRAMASRCEPLKDFARRIKQRLPGILSHCTYPLHTSLLEGVNNKIKVLKRMAYGYRDDSYFFLKIMAAFPGNPG